MKRYDIYADPRHGYHLLETDDCPSGEWVKYEDAQAAIQEAVLKEREACAKACEALKCEGFGNFSPPSRMDCVDAIRARSQK